MIIFDEYWYVDYKNIEDKLNEHFYLLYHCFNDFEFFFEKLRMHWLEEN